MSMKITQIFTRATAISFVLSVAVLGAFAQTGVIDKVWVEYGAKVKGETGIRIHTRFSVKNALNVVCVIQASVERSDGHSLKSRTNTYATKDGTKVLISKPFTPPFEPADYS